MSSTSVWHQALQSDVKHQSGTKCSSLMSNTSVWHQMLQSDVKHFSLTQSASVWCQTLQSDTKCLSLMSNNSVWHQVLQSDVKHFSLTPSTIAGFKQLHSDASESLSVWCQCNSHVRCDKTLHDLKLRRQNCIAARTENHTHFQNWKSRTFPTLKITHISKTENHAHFQHCTQYLSLHSPTLSTFTINVCQQCQFFLSRIDPAWWTTRSHHQQCCVTFLRAWSFAQFLGHTAGRQSLGGQGCWLQLRTRWRWEGWGRPGTVWHVGQSSGFGFPVCPFPMPGHTHTHACSYTHTHNNHHTTTHTSKLYTCTAFTDSATMYILILWSHTQCTQCKLHTHMYIRYTYTTHIQYIHTYIQMVAHWCIRWNDLMRQCSTEHRVYHFKWEIRI